MRNARKRVLRRDVANRAVQADVVVMLDVALHQTQCIVQRKWRSRPDVLSRARRLASASAGSLSISRPRWRWAFRWPSVKENGHSNLLHFGLAKQNPLLSFLLILLLRTRVPRWRAHILHP